MPAPAVYVLAIIGTVGAVIAFKEFVYEPHIAPRIEQWRVDYEANRRRRRSQQHDTGGVAMSERSRTVKSRKDSGKFSDDDDDDTTADHKSSPSFDVHSDVGPPRMSGGLLLRKAPPSTAHSHTAPQAETELPLLAQELTEWRNELSNRTGQDLRHRKNTTTHALDESVHDIPYVPLSPTPKTPSDGAPSILFANTTTLETHEHRPATSPPLNLSTIPSSPPAHTFPQRDNTPLDSSSKFSIVADSTSAASTTSLQSRSPFDPYPHNVPSLSQSYPQELDYEHGLELVSPPSSRSDSPFSIAALSPAPLGQRALSPAARNTIGHEGTHYSLSSPLSVSSQGLSSVAASNMGSPWVSMPQRTLAPDQPVIPASGTPYPIIFTTTNIPQSPARSTTLTPATSEYHSFAEDSASSTGWDSDDYDVGLNPNMPMASNSVIGSGALPTSPLPCLFPVAPRDPLTPLTSRPPSTEVRTSLGAGDPSYFHPAPSPAPPTAQPASAYLAIPSRHRAIRTLSSTSMSASDVRSDDGAELSDLDLLSDYAPSEADSEAVIINRTSPLSNNAAAAGYGSENESDSGWSFASGPSSTESRTRRA